MLLKWDFHYNGSIGCEKNITVFLPLYYTLIYCILKNRYAILFGNFDKKKNGGKKYADIV